MIFTTTLRHTPGRLRRARKTINVFVLCEKIYKLEKVGRYYYSPVRNDGRYPAFGIREDGEVGIDHGTGEGFNALTLIERVERLSRREAAIRLIHYADLYKSCRTVEGVVSQRPTAAPLDPQELVPFRWPFLAIGSHEDYLNFADLRRLRPMTLINATVLGLLHFFTDNKSGQRLCTVTDSARYVRQDRCVTGEEVMLTGGGVSKSRTIGKAAWPVGAADIDSKGVVLLTEGMPDLLAAIQLITDEKREDDTAAVAVLGAGQRIHPQALPLFTGKRVRIFPDNDPAGARAGQIWQRQLQEAGATVDLFSVAAHEHSGPGRIKDLNDFVVAGVTSPDGAGVIPTTDMKGMAQ